MELKCKFQPGELFVNAGEDPANRYGGVWTVLGCMQFEGKFRHIGRGPDLVLAVPDSYDAEGELIKAAYTQRTKNKLCHWFTEAEMQRVGTPQAAAEGGCVHHTKFDFGDLVEVRLPKPTPEDSDAWDTEVCEVWGACKVDGVRIEADKRLYRVVSTRDAALAGWRFEQQLEKVV